MYTIDLDNVKADLQYTSIQIQAFRKTGSEHIISGLKHKADPEPYQPLYHLCITDCITVSQCSFTESNKIWLLNTTDEQEYNLHRHATLITQYNESYCFTCPFIWILIKLFTMSSPVPVRLPVAAYAEQHNLLPERQSSLCQQNALPFLD